jgi:amyloid beta precursor protein binding protein 1
LIEANPDFVTDYTFIVATDLPESSLLKLADACFRHKIPLAVVRIYGWMCYLRLQLPSYPVIESKPDNTIPDLRMAVPFPELKTYADSFDLASLDDHKFSHVPFVVLLVKAVQAWRKSEGIADDVIPTPKNKEGILKALNDLKRRGVAGSNFPEASKFVMRTYVPYRVPDEVEALLNDERALNVTKDTPDFWVAVAALRLFRLSEGQGRYLPLIGTIPDMETESATFVEIKHVYNIKFEQDIASLQAHVHSLLKAAGRDEGSISNDYLRHIVRNAFALRNFTFRTMAEEYAVATSAQELFQMTPLVDASSDLKFYFLLRAADRFRTKNGHYPCSILNQELEVELPEYEETVNKLAAEYSVPADFITPGHILEFARWGGSSMHNMGAVLGGVAAQEIIKAVTQQWEPLNNTWIFNGMDATSAQLNL